MKQHELYDELCLTEASQAEGLSFDVGFHSDLIELYRLDVKSEFRWQGRATRFLKELTAIADRNNLPIELEVGSGTDEIDIVEDLPAFYNKFGFEWVDTYMRRIPQ